MEVEGQWQSSAPGMSQSVGRVEAQLPCTAAEAERRGAAAKAGSPGLEGAASEHRLTGHDWGAVTPAGGGGIVDTGQAGRFDGSSGLIGEWPFGPASAEHQCGRPAEKWSTSESTPPCRAQLSVQRRVGYHTSASVLSNSAAFEWWHGRWCCLHRSLKLESSVDGSTPSGSARAALSCSLHSVAWTGLPAPTPSAEAQSDDSSRNSFTLQALLRCGPSGFCVCSVQCDELRL